jgi:Bacterial lectin
MFRRGSKPPPSAADDERQALFEKLAQRPETVCPFLGLAMARAEYEPQATDEHRCYAFGEPEPVSGDQQRNVCLQRGYANCPRYLRGVLVIPTDELEALRRPPQKVPPPPPPKPAAAPQGGGDRRRWAVVLVVLLLLVGGGAAWWALAGPGAVAQEPTPTPAATSTASAEPSASSTLPTPGASPITLIMGTDALEPKGSASRTEDGIRLAPAKLQGAGAAWFPEPVVVAEGFTADFRFSLSGFVGDGGDGFAFVVQTTGPSALGEVGGELGYGGLARSLAVEFDTHFNNWPGQPDPNDNHISVHTNGSAANGGDHALSLGHTIAIPDLSTGQAHAVRIVYVPGNLTVLLDEATVLRITGLDLGAELDLEGGAAYVGFTASTGDTAQNTDLLSLEIALP